MDDVRGLIHKPVSYWAIDESGNPSRKMTENGKAFTLSAVTELSPIDYDKLLEGVPLYDGEVHFSRLRNEHPDICIRLMTDLGGEDILILSKTVRKRGRPTRSRMDGEPFDETYLYAILNDIVRTIAEVDLSDTVIVTYDRNPSIRERMCSLMWSDRCVVVMGESQAYRLIQMADLAASSLGRSFLPGEFADSSYFDRIRAKSVDVQCGRTELGGSTQLPPSTPDIGDGEEEHKICHGRQKKDGRAGGLTQRPPTALNTKDVEKGYKTCRGRTQKSKCKKRTNEGRPQHSPTLRPGCATQCDYLTDSGRHAARIFRNSSRK